MISREITLFSKILLISFCCAILSCKDKETVTNPDGNGEGIVTPKNELERNIVGLNNDLVLMKKMYNGEVKVLFCLTQTGGGMTIGLEDKTSFIVYADAEAADKKTIPIVGIDEEGYWVYKFNGKTAYLTPKGQDRVKAVGNEVQVPELRINDKKSWEVSFGDGNWYKIGDEALGKVEGVLPAAFSPYASASWNEDEKIVTINMKTGRNGDKFEVKGLPTTDAWNKFVNQTSDNVLLDFSYAGYMHGEVAPPEMAQLVASGYEVENVKEYMTLNPNLSCREAFLQLLKKHRLTRIDDESAKYYNPDAKVVFYFPEGEYVLHNDDDNYMSDSPDATAIDSKGNNASSSIMIYGGNFVIRGAGRDKTKLIMDTPNLPTSPVVMYSSPDMINIKYTSYLGNTLCNVVEDAPKGGFSVKVSNTVGVKSGDWVCLHVNNKSADVIAEELYPYSVESYMSDILDGIEVNDLHQVEKVEGDKITFVEPIMHEVKASWNWEIKKYNHFENVGVEDLTFVGHSKDNFKHHAGWEDDGAYKPISFGRLVNSWMRRVDFENVSEASSIYESANFSAYDINIKGNRGHAAIRSQGSSRVFIGKVTDTTNGPTVDDRIHMDGAGQYHACGVSKPSMGAVIWKVQWGADACFESHATQPRATLIDNCIGGFMQSRQGGDSNQVPNHLGDLTLWNLCAIRTAAMTNKGTKPANGEFDWWRIGGDNWKFLPPVIVGFHGISINFVQEQVKLDESHGMPVEPQSLYEAQLKKRLGYVPAWLMELK